MNRHRLERFGLCDILSAFLSSCWLGATKPIGEICHRAPGAGGSTALGLVDDREQNPRPASTLGMRTVRFAGASEPREELGMSGYWLGAPRRGTP